MTVGELLEKLHDYDWDDEIFVVDSSAGKIIPIDDIKNAEDVDEYEEESEIVMEESPVIVG